MTKEQNNQSVIRVSEGWGKMPDEKENTSLDLQYIVNWYYKNKYVVKVDYLNNGSSEWAYITLRRNGDE